MSKPTAATPQQYVSTFELYGDGQAVLADLVLTFGGAPFKPGQPDLTAFNCGAKAVIEHIYARINQAQA
jgi:hypothetical protein